MSDNLWTDATPLRSNDDFRRLLATPRPQNSATPRSTPRAKRVDDGEKKFKKPPPKSRVKPDAGDDDTDEPKYRDRAKERRDGRNVDYEGVEQELSQFLQDKGLEHHYHLMNPDDTKYLGGSMERTHLVKGLDTVLLQKEKERMLREKEAALKKGIEETPIIRKEEIKFHSPMARALYDHVFTPQHVDVKEMFQPRRTAFQYDFEAEEVVDRDIPTTVHRSKADCPAPVEAIFASCDAQVIERIVKIMSYMKVTSGKPHKKLKKKEKEELLRGILQDGEHHIAGSTVVVKSHNLGPREETQTNGTQKPKDEEEDIFGDAGRDYVPEVPEKSKGQAAGGGQQRNTTTYQEADMDVEEGEVAPPPPPPLPPPTGGDYMHPGPHPHDLQGYPGYQDMATYYQQQQAAGPNQQYMDPYAYEAYVQADVAYQASLDPEYQALVARQAALRTDPAETGEGVSEGPRLLTQQEKDLGLASVFKTDETKWRPQRKNKDGTEENKKTGLGLGGDDDDAYAECYPEYAGLGAEVVDSDEEDFSKMDTGGRGGMSRYDFNTEEEWQRYKESKEAMPKAAFQFGVKMSDGRKTHKHLDKHREQKLDNQLHQIEKKLKEQGYDHGRAFKKPVVEDDVVIKKKRQRI